MCVNKKNFKLSPKMLKNPNSIVFSMKIIINETTENRLKNFHSTRVSIIIWVEIILAFFFSIGKTGSLTILMVKRNMVVVDIIM